MNKIIDKIYILLMILVVVFMIWTGYYVRTNKEAFFENPFIFGANKMKGEVYCNCHQLIVDKRIDFAFNQTDIWSLPDTRILELPHHIP